MFIWVRFFRFPPYIQAYNDQLRRARFFSQSKYKAAEATVRFEAPARQPAPPAQLRSERKSDPSDRWRSCASDRDIGGSADRPEPRTSKAP